MSLTPKQLKFRAVVYALIGTLLSVTVVLIPVSIVLYAVALWYMKRAHETKHGAKPWWAKTGPEFYRDHVKR